MATFPSYDPLVGASKSSQPSVRRVRFGDGFEQRLTFGLNQDRKTWALTWDVTEEAADEIEAFLEARGGSESFDWSPPDETSTYKWICLEWNKTINFPGRGQISATFEEVFDL
jgi:phage-related protein|tara:strand:- start:11 stop:349 length:339 start_codon:yes stop_codon:yes gene_type:complete